MEPTRRWTSTKAKDTTMSDSSTPDRPKAGDDTMWALRAPERGGPEQLRFERAPIPSVDADEVLVAVHAAAITFDELLWDETWQPLPAVPSHEVSGVVAAVGADVTEFAPGDEVYGLIRFDRQGAAAEFVSVPEEDLAARPRSVPHAEAAALPLAGLTAWQALFDHARLQAGERLLVLRGAGGVGVFATQLGRDAGAEVTVTVRGAAAAAAARRLGATTVIDVTTQSLPDDTFDVVLDTVGGSATDQAYALARRGGRLITLQAPPSESRAAERDLTAVFFIVVPDRAQLAELARLVDEHRLDVPLAATFPLESGREAFESRGTRGPGKTVLVVRP